MSFIWLGVLLIMFKWSSLYSEERVNEDLKIKIFEIVRIHGNEENVKYEKHYLVLFVQESVENVLRAEHRTKCLKVQCDSKTYVLIGGLIRMCIVFVYLFRR